MSHLPVNTHLLNGAFVIGKVLGRGGFGITYLSGDMNLRRVVAIKEFFPEGCVRQGNSIQPDGALSATEYSDARTKFLEEARSLARFRHSGIVGVHTFFEENNSAYMVMEYLKGKTLAQLVEERGALPEQEAIGYIKKIGEALEELHRAQLLHRDVKPENVIVCEDGRAVLIDFGLSKKVEEVIGLGTRQLAATTRFGSDGFAPPEQYLRSGVLGKYTDVYALGATLYFLLTGTVPTSAPERAMGAGLTPVHQVNLSISHHISDAVANAMGLDNVKRPQSAQDFLHLLRSQTTSNSLSANTPATTSAGLPQRIQQLQNVFQNFSKNYSGNTPVPSVATGAVTGQIFNSVAYGTKSKQLNYARSAQCFYCKENNYIPNSVDVDDFILCYACNQKFGIIAPSNPSAPTNLPSSTPPLTVNQGRIEIGRMQFELQGSLAWSFDLSISVDTSGGHQSVHIMTIPRDGRRSPQILSGDKNKLAELKTLIEKAESMLS